jgi:DNA-binding transcriptional LysR family regulator
VPNAGPFATRVIAAIAEAHPNLEVVGRSVWSSEAVGALDAGTIEAAVVRDPVPGPAYEWLALGDYHDDHVAIAAADPLADHDELTLADLEDRPVLVPERRLAELVHDATLAFFAEHAVTPRRRYHGVQDYAQLMTLVAGGQGACLVPVRASRCGCSGAPTIRRRSSRRYEGSRRPTRRSESRGRATLTSRRQRLRCRRPARGRGTPR